MVWSQKSKLGRTFLYLLIITMTTALIYNCKGQTLSIELETDRQIYAIGENVNMSGNVTWDGQALPDALVAIEIHDSNGIPVIMRARPTGMIFTPYVVQILNVTPCDDGGNPKSSFVREKLAYFKISLNNTASSLKYAVITLNIFDSRGVPFEAAKLFEAYLQLGITELLVSVPIPPDIYLGDGVVYANAFTALPCEGGFAYCEEYPAFFSIVESEGSFGLLSFGQHAETNLTLTFLLDNYESTRRFSRGNYTIFATCQYLTQTATLQKTFKVVLIGDINDDGWVELSDFFLLSLAFGSSPGSPNWNPQADVAPWPDGDNLVELLDFFLVSLHFGENAP